MRLTDLLLPAPMAEQVAASRAGAGCTAAKMAEMLGLGAPARIYEYESGARQMPAATWSMWLLMCGQHPSRTAGAPIILQVKRLF